MQSGYTNGFKQETFARIHSELTGEGELQVFRHANIFNFKG
jgi:hypothetical protein